MTHSIYLLVCAFTFVSYPAIIIRNESGKGTGRLHFEVYITGENESFFTFRKFKCIVSSSCKKLEIFNHIICKLEETKDFNIRPKANTVYTIITVHSPQFKITLNMSSIVGVQVFIFCINISKQEWQITSSFSNDIM